MSNIPKKTNQIILKVIKKVETIAHNKKDDFTTVTSKAAGTEQTINKENREVHPANKEPSKNKKAMIIIASIILVMIAGVFGKIYAKEKSTNLSTPTVKTIVPKQSTGETGSSGGTTGTPSTNGSAGETTGTPSTTGTPKTTGTPSTTGTPKTTGTPSTN